ncbi:MAG: DUF2269 family protein [Prevotellaceae bacterium]|nr:DUF2269 family protein [Prevotellaceae bacterium]MDO4932032.1 DUF2269 family protein [Prevotellaceae bacterium]
MKKLSSKGMKALKVIHLICAIAWFGSGIALNLLRHLVEVNDAAGMYWMAEILETIDMKILVPGAVGCLLTGIVYGAFTNWGFFKHRWLTVKWVLTIFMILLGTFSMGPLVRENVMIGKAILDGCGDATQYWRNVTANEYTGLLQIVLLTVVTVISVYKPWKKRQK